MSGLVDVRGLVDVQDAADWVDQIGAAHNRGEPCEDDDCRDCEQIRESLARQDLRRRREAEREAAADALCDRWRDERGGAS